jgi:hypothetical protein
MIVVIVFFVIFFVIIYAANRNYGRLYTKRHWWSKKEYLGGDAWSAENISRIGKSWGDRRAAKRKSEQKPPDSN